MRSSICFSWLLRRSFRCSMISFFSRTNFFRPSTSVSRSFSSTIIYNLLLYPISHYELYALTPSHRLEGLLLNDFRLPVKQFKLFITVIPSYFYAGRPEECWLPTPPGDVDRALNGPRTIGEHVVYLYFDIFALLVHHYRLYAVHESPLIDEQCAGNNPQDD